MDALADEPIGEHQVGQPCKDLVDTERHSETKLPKIDCPYQDEKRTINDDHSSSKDTSTVETFMWTVSAIFSS